MTLKDLQKYKLTIPVIVVLFLIVVIFMVFQVVNTKNYTAIAPPVASPTAPLSSVDPEINNIPWEKITIGTDKKTIDGILKISGNTEQKEGYTIARYETKTPLFYHQIWYKDDKAQRIDRFVNERKQLVTPEYYRTTYGKPEILREGFGIITQLEAYTPAKNQHLVIEVDTQYNYVYKIILTTDELYAKYKQTELNTENPDDQLIGPQ